MQVMHPVCCGIDGHPTQLTACLRRVNTAGMIHTVADAMSDLFGTSGRWMLKALCKGERDPKKLAALALGSLRRKLPALELALTGQFTAHHGRLMQGELELMELLERQIAELDAQIREATEPFAPQLEQLHSLPSVKAITARDLIAESGVLGDTVG
jgi:transposase